MRILHISDLHLGTSWKGQARLVDQMRVLDDILGLCEQENVELLLVTGDIFADRVEGSLSSVARQFLEKLRGQLTSGRVVFLLRGNHDQFQFFQLLRTLVNEMSGEDRWPLVIADIPGVYRIPGHNSQILALPYMSPTWLEDRVPDTAVTPEERLAGLSGKLAYLVQQLSQSVRPDAPAVFAAHVLVRGAELQTDRTVEMGYAAELVLDPRYLPSFTSYNALGHIHLAQPVQHAAKPTRYAGGIDRLDLGEQDYKPCALLVTTPDQPGGVATVEEVALPRCTPFVRATLAGVQAVEDFCMATAAPDPLGVITLADIPVDQRVTIEDCVRRIAPRAEIRYALAPTPLTVEDHIAEVLDFHDICGTVDSYLARTYGETPERLERLRTAFRTLLAAPAQEQNR